MSAAALLTIKEAFVVPGRGLAVTGRLHDGDLDVGDRLWLLADGVREMLTVRRLDRDGDDVALLLDGAAQGMVRPGLVLAGDGRL